MVKKNILTNNPCYKAGIKMAVKGLMLHSVGCEQPDAQVFMGLWNSGKYKIGVHAVIDANTGASYQCLPWDYRGGHCKGEANNTHIAVEMCEPDRDGSEGLEMVHRAYASAVLLFAELCIQFNLNPLSDGVILSHKEGYKRGLASNHGDPENLWKRFKAGYTMDGFREDVSKAIKERREEMFYIKIKIEDRDKAEALQNALSILNIESEILSDESDEPNKIEAVSITEIAKEVIAGKWGSGSERKRRLTQAGFSYEEVQAEVNRILR